MKILLIEDKPSLLLSVKHYLDEEGYIVSTASTFKEAIERVNDYDCDCTTRWQWFGYYQGIKTSKVNIGIVNFRKKIFG